MIAEQISLHKGHYILLLLLNTEQYAIVTSTLKICNAKTDQW